MNLAPSTSESLLFHRLENILIYTVWYVSYHVCHIMFKLLLLSCMIPVLTLCVYISLVFKKNHLTISYTFQKNAFTIRNTQFLLCKSIFLQDSLPNKINCGYIILSDELSQFCWYNGRLLHASWSIYIIYILKPIRKHNMRIFLSDNACQYLNSI